LNGSSNGFLENLSWRAIVAGIATFLGLFFGLPDYILNIRPQIEKAVGASSLSFIEGAISGAVTAIVVLKILAQRYKKGQSKGSRMRSTHASLILNDLENWIKKTTFSDISYYQGRIKETKHEDPKVGYLDEDKRILKEYGALTLWEEGTRTSEKLRSDGKEAIENFHNIVDEELKNMPLKRSLEIGTLSVPYYSVPRVRETIFEEINGEHAALEARSDEIGHKPFVVLGNKKAEVVTGRLWHGEVKLAWGKIEVVNQLRETIEQLIEDEKIRREIAVYNERKRKLASSESFSAFKNKVAEIIAELRQND
jgi:hypothetical protein